jgi:hypothetical protein
VQAGRLRYDAFWNCAMWEKWNQVARGTPPMYWLLRCELRDRWFRIHSLPEGKRYPTSKRDEAELLRRHNEVATAVLGTSAPCTVFSMEWGKAADLASPMPDWRVHSDRQEDIDELLANARFVAKQIVWSDRVFDREILAVADDKESHVVLSHATAGIYSPYDGGADLFPALPDDVAPLKRRFAAWLSDRPDGL